LQRLFFYFTFVNPFSDTVSDMDSADGDTGSLYLWLKPKIYTKV